MPVNTANATWLGDDVEPRLCDCPKFVPWHRGPAEYNLTTTTVSSRPISRGSGGYPKPPEAKLAFQKSKWFSVVPRGLAGIHFFASIAGSNPAKKPSSSAADSTSGTRAPPSAMPRRSRCPAWCASPSTSFVAVDPTGTPPTISCTPPRLQWLSEYL